MEDGLRFSHPEEMVSSKITILIAFVLRNFACAYLLTQQDIADKCKLDRSTVSRLMQDNSKGSFATLEKISEELGLGWKIELVVTDSNRIFEENYSPEQKAMIQRELAAASNAESCDLLWDEVFSDRE